MSECLFRKIECLSKNGTSQELLKAHFDKHIKLCQLCLIGQLCDETSLNTRAFMDASIDKLEKGMSSSDKDWMEELNQ